MPKYLVQASYVGEGLKGLIKEGGTSRRETVAKVIEGLDGFGIVRAWVGEGITDIMTRWSNLISG